MLFLPSDVIGEPGVGIVDAHRAAQIPLRVLDAFQLVDAQLQDPFAHLAHPQLGGNHRYLRSVSSDRWRGVRRSEDVRILFGNVGVVVGWQSHGMRVDCRRF